MKSIFIILSLLAATKIYTQNLVIGKPSSGMTSIIAFSTKDNLCESSIDKTEIIWDSIFLIVDEIKCRNNFDFFILLHNERILFAKNIQFNKFIQIREDLDKLKKNIPDFKERIKYVESKGKVYIDSVRILFERNLFLKDSIEKVRNDSLKVIEKRKLDSAAIATRKLVDKLGPRQTIISSWSIHEKKYLDDYYDIEVNVFNPFRKKIKYIKFIFYAFNPVGDPAIDFLSKSHIKSVQGVGPIEPLDNASYYFKTVYWSSTLSKIKLKTVVVTFFDSTTTSISDPIEWNID